MKRISLMWILGIVFVGAMLAPTGAFAQISCSREGLQRAVDLYITAQTKGDTSGMPLATGVGYWENIARADINTGLIKKAMKIDHHRSLLDPDSCQTFTEVIVTDKVNPYVLGTRLRVNHDKIADVEILWTTTGYFFFNADDYLKYSSTENWGAIPANRRDTRGTLVAAANAYLDAFLEQKTDLVPWGIPCQRVEGGRYFGTGGPTDSCNVGVPAGVNISNRRFVVDETIGSVVVFCTFGAGNANGGSGAPDTHLFRVENGKLRYVHTLTHLLQSGFRGAGAPPAGGAAGAGAGQRGGARVVEPLLRVLPPEPRPVNGSTATNQDDRFTRSLDSRQFPDCRWCGVELGLLQLSAQRGRIMAKKTTVAIAHSNADLGKPGECSREQLDVVKQMIRQIADQTMGGMQNIVKRGDKVLIKVNTVIPVAPNAGFTTDPRMLQALIELVGEQNPSRIQIGERCAMGADTRQAMQECGLADVAQRTGAELCPFEHAPFDMYKIDRPIAFNEFPVPRPVREADVYIGLPKFKVHVHTVFTGALKLQFGNLPDYDWMVRCHHDNIFQKIVNLTRAANPKWFVMDSLYACQGNGPFSPYPEDLIKDWNTICGGPDPVAVDTVCEALMDWDYPGTNAPAVVLGAAEGLGTNRLDEIEITGSPLNQVKRRFKRASTVLQGQYPNVNVVMGSDCDAGCKAIVRIQFDQLQADGTLEILKRPLYVFAGVQFEQFQPVVKPSDGDVIVVGDCAKSMLDHFPNARFWGDCEEYPGYTPIWANRPDVGIASYVRELAAQQQ